VGFTTENLQIRYGKHVALRDITIHFESGALGLLGPNGAGKSSLIRAILGFIQPAGGTISVLGQSPGNDPRLLRQKIGFHPEDDALIPGLNAVAAVTLCGELSGLPRSDALQRAHEILHFVGLGEVRYRSAETYSQGMRQRLKLAQALVHDPELLILDEPTNGLDPRGRQEILDLLIDLVRNKGMKLILSSHLLPDVEAVCDQIAVLDKGQLIKHGSLESLLKGASRAFEIRLKGPIEKFEAAIRARGGTCKPGNRGMVQVETTEGSAPLMFALAREAGCQIRHMMPVRTTLSEVFTNTVAQGRADANS